jgi:hypothetical protein
MDTKGLTMFTVNRQTTVILPPLTALPSYRHNPPLIEGGDGGGDGEGRKRGNWHPIPVDAVAISPGAHTNTLRIAYSGPLGSITFDRVSELPAHRG